MMDIPHLLTIDKCRTKIWTFHKTLNSPAKFTRTSYLADFLNVWDKDMNSSQNSEMSSTTPGNKTLNSPAKLTRTSYLADFLNVQDKDLNSSQNSEMSSTAPGNKTLPSSPELAS